MPILFEYLFWTWPRKNHCLMLFEVSQEPCQESQLSHWNPFSAERSQGIHENTWASRSPQCGIEGCRGRQPLHTVVWALLQVAIYLSPAVHGRQKCWASLTYILSGLVLCIARSAVRNFSLLS